MEVIDTRPQTGANYGRSNLCGKKEGGWGGGGGAEKIPPEREKKKIREEKTTSRNLQHSIHHQPVRCLL